MSAKVSFCSFHFFLLLTELRLFRRAAVPHKEEINVAPERQRLIPVISSPSRYTLTTDPGASAR